MSFRSTRKRPSYVCRSILTVAPAAVVAVALLACVNPPERAILSTSPTAAASIAPPARYLLQVGDRLSIEFHDAQELNQDLIVRPDGKISMSLVGELMAAGLEPMQLQASLAKAYAKTLREPEPTVIVRQFNNRVYVGGEVNKPGTVRVEGQLTALQAIFDQGSRAG